MFALDNLLHFVIITLETLQSRRVIFPGSSAVEQTTVNRLAGGSNPSRGANFALLFIDYLNVFKKYLMLLMKQKYIDLF